MASRLRKTLPKILGNHQREVSPVDSYTMVSHYLETSSTTQSKFHRKGSEKRAKTHGQWIGLLKSLNLNFSALPFPQTLLSLQNSIGYPSLIRCLESYHQTFIAISPFTAKFFSSNSLSSQTSALALTENQPWHSSGPTSQPHGQRGLDRWCKL